MISMLDFPELRKTIYINDMARGGHKGGKGATATPLSLELCKFCTFFLSFVPFFLSFDPFSIDLCILSEKVLFLKNLAYLC